MSKELPKIVVDERGFLRIKLPSGEMLPETSLKIENELSKNGRSEAICEVTVSFLAEHELKNKK